MTDLRKAVSDLFAALDRADPPWRSTTLVSGEDTDEVNAAWCALASALESPPPSDSRALEEARAEGRREGIEEAATYCDRQDDRGLFRNRETLAKEIRSLSTPPPKKGTRDAVPPQHQPEAQGVNMATPKAAKKSGKAKQYVVVRTYSAGVHVGELADQSADGKRVVLTAARRVWSWKGANTLHEIALRGVGAGSRISEAVEQITLTEAIEIIQCAPAGEAALRSAQWAA